MSFIYHNIRRMSFSNWKSNLLIFVDMAVCTAIFFIMLHNYTLSLHTYREELTDTVLAQRVCINLNDPSNIAGMTSGTPIYDVALKVQKEILNSPDWIAYEGFHLFDFPYSREVFPNAVPEDVLTRFSFKYMYDYYVTSMSIYSTTFMTQNGLRVSEGRTFQDSDFNIIDCPVSIIIGAKLAPYLDVGDVVTSGNGQAIVVGILEEDSFWIDSGQDNSSDEIDINKSFIFAGDLPLMTGRTTLENREIDRLHALMNGGVIVPHDKHLDVQDKINQITAKYGFYPLIVTSVNMNEITNTTIVSEKNLLLLSILAVLTSSLAVLSVGTVLLRRTRKDIPNICVFLMSGIPLGKIMMSILIDLLFWGSLALLPSLVLSWTEYRAFIFPIWQLLLFHYGALFIAFIPIIPTLGRINLDYNIRAGGE